MPEQENVQQEPQIVPATDDGLAEAGKKAIAEERKQAREAQRRATEMEARLKEYEDRDKSEMQRITERAVAAEAERDAHRVDLTRFRLATRYGLSESDLRFLPAGSDEEMEGLAKDLSDRLKAQAPTGTTPGPRPDLSQGPKGDLPLNGDPLLNDIKRTLGIG